MTKSLVLFATLIEATFFCIAQPSARDSIRVDTSKPDNSAPFYVVEVPPKFPGGQAEMTKFIGMNIVYPSVAEKHGIEGKVIVRFVVEKNGGITKPTILRSIAPAFDKEALRVIKLMPKWNPGKIKGRNVRTVMTVPIKFAIPRKRWKKIR